MELLIVLGVVALVGLYALTVYNGLIARRNRVRNAWAQIDVQLKRRHDLVPNLVSAVKGYMAHERSLVEEVSRARQAAIAAGNDVAARSAAEGELTRSLRSLFAVAEAYPVLKANQNVLALQEELSSTENRVAFSRQHYNDSVMEYNIARETLPAVLFAPALRFGPEQPFALEDPVAERAVPQVRL